MSRLRTVERKYAPEQVLRLARATSLVEEALDHIDLLQEELWLDIVDGWSTQDLVLDFALVASNGAYDEHLLNKPYQELRNLGRRDCGRKVLIVQMSECWIDDDVIVLRNIYYGQIRNDDVDFDLDLQLISVPLVPPYFIFREFIQDDLLLSGRGVCDEDVVRIGPLRNEYCGIDYSKRNSDGTIVTPMEAVSDVLVHPWDMEHLSSEYGIENDLLQQFNRSLIRAQNKPKRS